MSELNLAIYNGLGIYFSQKGKELRPGYIALTQRVDADNYLNSDGGIGEKIKFKETEEFFYKVFSNREEYQAVIQKLYEEGVGDPFERRPEIKAYASKLLEKYEATTYELRIAIVFVRAIIPSYREFKILGKYYNGFKIQEGGLAIHYDDDFEAPLRKRYGSLLPKHFIDAPEDERVAVCLEYSFLLVSLLRAVGIKAYIKGGKHSYVIAILDGKKYMIDIVRLKFEETTESPDTDFEAIISHHFNHYRILAGQGKADKALEILKTILKINPNNIAVLIEMGMEFSKQKKLEKALAAFKRVLEIDQNSVGAWNNIGVVLIKQGKLKEALKAFNKVLEIDPGNTITQSNKKLLLTKLRRNPR